jgi:Tol biopolymer transport system component
MEKGQILKLLGPTLVLANTAWAQVTMRVSVGAGGVQGNGFSGAPAISADGLSVAFHTDASNLISWDTNGLTDVYFRAWQIDYTEIVSVDSSAVLGDHSSYFPSISADGRIVAFMSYATDLVPGDTNSAEDVFVRSRSSGTTERVSISSGGLQGNGGSYAASISADGRFVAFASFASNLVPGDTNGTVDVFLRDRLSGVTELVSIGPGGGPGNGASQSPSISADGRYVAFASDASDLVPGDTNGVTDVFVRDRLTGVTTRVSVGSGGVEGNGPSYSPAISADGLSVAFASDASNLISWDTNGFTDVYFRAWQIDYTEIVSVDSSAALGNGPSGSPSISADGRIVAFASDATNLVLGDTNGVSDVFVRNRSHGTTERVSISSGGLQGNGSSLSPSISADGRFVAFASDAAFLVPGDTNGTTDIFIRDRDATSFTSLCDPGVDGVLSCPCSNNPSGSGRGCDNSAHTGGAVLSASGIAYLSMDSLVFTTSGEKPTALSVLSEWTGGSSTGHTYGMGVRCTTGTSKRLFTKSAVGGSISVPNFGAGDPTISARSAAKGDVISAGQSRWYLVFYRDPSVLGGCPATSTFNATQTGQVEWGP